MIPFGLLSAFAWSLLRLNTIGTTIRTKTGLPFWVPGLNAGALCNTLTASASQPLPIPLIAFTSVKEPSFPTTNSTSTRPSTPACRASNGYLISFMIYRLKASIPPSNSGCFSTMVKISPSVLLLSPAACWVFLFGSSLHANTVKSNVHRAHKAPSFQGLTFFACCFIAINRFKIRLSWKELARVNPFDLRVELIRIDE
jgi:hypothetical protein